ncbi:glycoside hydrolase superfamily [Aspergillus ambiguus]|uniref:glycoside hydrolase superfamily n=1 Tax=Aspergillus ambiguus TaxID=176160 RepID=UPI003CCCC3CF
MSKLSLVLMGSLRLIGSLLIAGFDGTQLTSNICRLIEEHYVGAILITAKNLINAIQATKLIKDLQHTAYKAGHEYPLLIAIDQENGGCNSIEGSDEICQFPSSMGVVAGQDPSRARAIAKATANEMKSLGVNWILGPVLDIASKSGTNTLGTRMMDENPDTVARFGNEFVAGYHEGAVATCGKHFPSYGNLEFDNAVANIPHVHDTLEELRQNAFIPFQAAIKEGTDSIMVGACAMPAIKASDVQHACLSEIIVTDLLRQELGFGGVVLCECLEVESLYESVGFGQAGIMALSAGCDMLMVCNSFTHQLEILKGIHAAVGSEILPKSQLQDSVARISKMKQRYTSWPSALNPKGADGLLDMASMHRPLALSAYESSITVVRDTKSILPLSAAVDKNQRLLLLTPLLAPLSASPGNHCEEAGGDTGHRARQLLEGEQTFRGLGALLAKHWEGEVMHTSYGPSGARPYHEELIGKGRVVIVVTADASRNPYQYGFAKYIGMLCSNEPTRPKYCIVVATSSPYDFLHDSQIPTYICTYDYTDSALLSLTKILFGHIHPTGVSPGRTSASRSSTKYLARKFSSVWLTQPWDAEQDFDRVCNLLEKFSELLQYSGQTVQSTPKNMLQNVMKNREFTVFVVKNTSTQSIYGVVVTSYMHCILRGSLVLLFVDPERRRLGIGQSLYQRAILHLRQQKNARDIQLGSELPALIPGIPAGFGTSLERTHLKNWLSSRGWTRSTQGHNTILKILDIESCTPLLAPNPLRWSPAVLGREEFHQLDIVSHINKYLKPYAHDKSALLQPAAIEELYCCAREPSSNVDILIVRDSNSGVVVGAALFHGQNSSLAQYFPYLGPSGSLSGILVDPSDHGPDILSSILLMAIGRCRYLACPSLECRLPANYLDLNVFLQAGFQLIGEYSALYRDSLNII